VNARCDIDGFLWQIIPVGPGYQLPTGRYPNGIATGVLSPVLAAPVDR
jgi:hypothetical protein